MFPIALTIASFARLMLLAALATAVLPTRVGGRIVGWNVV